MTIYEANAILSETTVYIFQIGNEYVWGAIMSESRGFATVQDAYYDACRYIEEGGY